jgi:hypothetical protein
VAVYDDVIVSGRGSPVDEPCWDPLEEFLPLDLCGPFMWMHAVDLHDGRRLQAYKHSETRRYLHLDDDADSYEVLDGAGYRRMRHSEAIEFVFTPWWVLNHATDAEREALRAGLAAAWERGNGDEAAGAHILPSSPACGFRRLPPYQLEWES